MEKIKKNKKNHLDANNPIAQGLFKMAIHKRLRHQFRRGEITLEELNHQLQERNIPRHYENSATV
jgi:hypothetical protein